MDEEKAKKIHRKKARKEQEKKQGSFADKLKTAEDKRAYVGEKLRSGKKDVSETRAELLENTRIKKQSRSKTTQMSYAIAAETVHRVSDVTNADNTQENEEDVASQIVKESENATQNTLISKKQKYGRKLHDKQRIKEIEGETSSESKSKLGERKHKKGDSPKSKKDEALRNEKSKEIQKLRLKAKMQREGYGKAPGKGLQNIGERITDKVQDFFSEMAKKVIQFVSENPIGVIVALLLLVIVLAITSGMSSCSMIGGGASDATIATTFTADDEDILAVDDDYTELEEGLQEYIDEFEANNPDYDEYIYMLDEIGHNPFELAAILTVLYESYTENEVQEMLEYIYKNQYVVTVTEKTESRTRTVYDPDLGTERTEEFECRIAVVTVENRGIDAVVRDMNLSEDDMSRYELLLETYGNKKYLFENDIYAIKDRGVYENYKIPSEYLTDKEFAGLIKEAEKYLGMNYVWGGSTPEEGFDCSGFVSYVINHSGNGWNVGRPTANGLVNKCTKISVNNAKPGDLVFFKDTYKGAPSGASHVGIYVGNGMMIHCGNPIQYTSIKTPFWQSHLYTYGRLDH